MPDNDWKPEKITQALTKKGLTVCELLHQYQLIDSNFSCQRLEAAIADALDVPLHIIWPSRYKSIDGGKDKRK